MNATKLSRRQFLGGTAAVAAASVLPAVAGVAPAVAAPSTAVIPDASIKTGWTPLDPEALARQAYDLYKGKNSPQQTACCEATYWPIIGALADKFPSSAYAQIPKGLFNYGGGGVNAWRSICGCPNGGAAMLKQVGAPGKVIDEYLAWYERTPFPTNNTYLSAQKGDWTPVVMPKDNAPMAVPNGILCHASVGRWVEASGGSTGAWAKKHFGGDIVKSSSDRCGKLCFDTVYKLAELINDWMAGAPLPSGASDPSVATCLTGGCHGGVYDNVIDDACAPEVLGKMKCDESCHQ